jgi:hypothetical protein
MNKIDRNKIVIDVCKFLKRHDALERYCYNVVLYHHIRVPAGLTLKERVLYIVDRQVSRVNEDYHPRLEYFFQDCNTCFYWGETPEGVSFWSNLHRKWYNIVTGGEL